jgi:hypothetical protein
MKRKVWWLLNLNESKGKKELPDKVDAKENTVSGTKSERCDRKRNSMMYRTWKENQNMSYMVKAVHVVARASVMRRVSNVVGYQN